MVRLTDRLDMAIPVDWDVKPETNKTCVVVHNGSLDAPNKYQIRMCI